MSTTDWNTHRDTALAGYPPPILPNGTPDPRFNQFKASTWDGQPSEDASNACGMTCVTAEGYFQTGVYIPPDTLKGKILDASGSTDQQVTGTSTMPELRSCAQDVYQISTSEITPSTAYGNGYGSVLYWVWFYSKQGLSVCELRNTYGVPHWSTAVGLDPTTVWVFDPGVGQVLTETYAQHAQRYLGASVSGGGMFAFLTQSRA